jgi:predicted nicotinamide N-methyase
LSDDVKWSVAFNWRKDFDFAFNDGERVVVLRIQQNPLNSPVGFVVWEACFLLCNYLVKEYGRVGRNRYNGCCVELGCGTALCGLVAAALGFRVTLTDQENTLPIASRNVEANRAQLRGDVSVRELDWGSSSVGVHLANKADVIIGSELLYTHDVTVYERLRDTMLALSHASTVIVLVYEERGCRESEFVDMLCAHYACVDEIQCVSFHPGSTPLVHLVRVSNKRAT